MKKLKKNWIGWLEKGVTPFSWSNEHNDISTELMTGGEGIFKNKNPDKTNDTKEQKIRITVEYL